MKVLFRSKKVFFDNPIESGVVFPEKTSIIFLVGGSQGEDTCFANCEHCFWPQQCGKEKHTRENIDFKIEQEKKIIRDLSKEGYPVLPVPPDSFAWDGRYLKDGMLKKSLYYDQGEVKDIGIAWTSGIPLIRGDHIKLLSLAKQNDLGILVMTSHGTRDGEIPFSGAVRPSIVRTALEKVKDYNERSGTEKIMTCLNFSIGKYNLNRMEEFIAYSAMLGVDYLRFNKIMNFTNSEKVATLTLSNKENAYFFKKIYELRGKSTEEIVKKHYKKLKGVVGIDDLKFNRGLRLMVSTDFGCYGEIREESGDFENVCPGGRNLFGLANNIIYPCNELFTVPIGRGVWVKDRKGGSTKRYTLEFDSDSLKKLNIVINGRGYYGCVAYTLLTRYGGSLTNVRS